MSIEQLCISPHKKIITQKNIPVEGTFMWKIVELTIYNNLSREEQKVVCYEDLAYICDDGEDYNLIESVFIARENSMRKNQNE